MERALGSCTDARVPSTPYGMRMVRDDRVKVDFGGASILGRYARGTQELRTAILDERE